EARKAAEEAEQRYRNLEGRSGLSKAQAEKTFSRFSVNSETKEAFDYLSSWTFGNYGATLLGLPGVGKTHLLISFAMKQMQLGHIVRFFNFNELVGKFRQLSLLPGQSYESELEKIKKSSILILDDIGTERGTPLSADLFNCILEYRLNNRLPLFVTTNCSESDLVLKFHERAYSRLKELTILLQVNGADYRNKIQIDLQNKKMKLTSANTQSLNKGER
ncbi:MAG: ATP-binding protein, partial [Pseudobdellovibrionaceae bacterium]